MTYVIEGQGSGIRGLFYPQFHSQFVDVGVKPLLVVNIEKIFRALSDADGPRQVNIVQNCSLPWAKTERSHARRKGGYG